MREPVFEEYEPAGDCPCRGCVRRRRALAAGRAVPLRDGGHPGAHGARRALVVVTAAGVVLGGGGVTSAAAATDPVPPGGTGRSADADQNGAPVARDDPGTPQGQRGPLHGPSGVSAKPPRTTTPAKVPVVRHIERAAIINRAKLWLDEQVPYSMEQYWSDGYRQDCSGFVSMAWNLGTNEWTGSLDKFATRISKDELLPGDMLLFHNPSNPNKGSHVVLFGGWVDETRTHYIAYEQTKPITRRLATPYGYWNNATKYVPYRFNGVTGGISPDDANPGGPHGTPPVTPVVSTGYPGASKFGPGADNEHVARLARMLIDRGGMRFYPNGPSTRWSEADRLATQAFQQAQGWTDAEADGLPGPETWKLLVDGQGKDIRPTVAGGTPPKPTTPPKQSNPPKTGSPGAPRPTVPPGTGTGTGTGIGTGTGTRPVRPGVVPPFPGAGVFRPGKAHPAIEALGRQLARKGFGKYYRTGPGPRWSEADRRAVEAFQRAQGWRGAEADGYPGPETWRRLFA
ncbi:peptidoglycan-binding protein [Streptomyces sp. NPDC089799]|uniref:peptidoglycan-binding protein n=1 Tax=Streptomyces sp. NPDC089799 TaxID=3155066 RepID=UPI0034227F56